MRSMKSFVLPTVCGLVLLAGVGVGLADTTVQVNGTHLCCPACIKGVETAVKGIEGVTARCVRKEGMIIVSGKDNASVQKALDALGEAGYYGITGHKSLVIPAAKVTAGKVEKLELTGAHNCCRSCCASIKGTLKNVKGVKGDTAAPKASSFEVTGNFDPAAVVKALNAAGFQVKVKADGEPKADAKTEAKPADTKAEPKAKADAKPEAKPKAEAKPK